VEICEFRARGGRVGPAEAEVKRWSAGARIARSVGAAGVGVAIGLAMAPIPGLHLVGWVPALATIGVGAYLWGVRVRLDRVRGPCPACGAPVDATGIGLVGREEVWIRCDGCGAPIVVTLAAA
jgi:hypothetical protein